MRFSQLCCLCGTPTTRKQILGTDRPLCDSCWKRFLGQDDVVETLRSTLWSHIERETKRRMR